MARSASDMDTAWKEMIERWFPAFFEFYFPDVYQEIDWAREFEFLDKELNYAVRVAGRGRRSVDKLARVYLKDGKDVWVLAHVEAQSQKEETFSERMFGCNTMLFATHRHTVASFAILGDPVLDWRPDCFGYSQWGSGADSHFRTKKLLDYTGREDDLAHNLNPFAIITLAHLKTLSTQRSDESRFEWKVRILNYLYEQERPEDQMADLVRCLDLMMPVTKPRQDKFDSIWRQHEERRKMATAFLSNIERNAMRAGKRAGREEGKEEGVKVGREEGDRNATMREARTAVMEALNAKFDRAADTLTESIKRIDDLSLLRALLRSAVTAPSLDDFRKQLPSG